MTTGNEKREYIQMVFVVSFQERHFSIVFFFVISIIKRIFEAKNSVDTMNGIFMDRLGYEYLLTFDFEGPVQSRKGYPETISSRLNVLKTENTIQSILLFTDLLLYE